MKKTFHKKFLSVTEQLNLLKKRGLLIENDERAKDYLKHIGYFRLSAYFHPLLKMPKKHIYKTGAAFKQGLDMYRFDRKLRLLLFNEIEKVEVAIRAEIVNAGCALLKDIFWLTNPQYFKDKNRHAQSLLLIEAELSKSKEDHILHFKNNYNNKYPPAWILAEILPLGVLGNLYINIADRRLQKQIAKTFGLQAPVLISWLMVLANIRNICCHHGRMWNRELPNSPSELKKPTYKWIDDNTANRRRLYYKICMIKYLLHTITPNNKLKQKLIELSQLYPTIDFQAMNFPTDWHLQDFWN
ncbi:MAG TPA: Abi family protein [Bacteroidales bacterium]|jgi:abortive infection bacteriophage resistance protein|nr:Abi family protein [Bacteroidales bacterium]HPY21522.1 Abi family protein [Bacteroidales bacterium]HQN24024.1 Abi family protein [Bacteroidales bacterium]HQP78363.1 Abi family protein [Bacteroidales bacterium]